MLLTKIEMRGTFCLLFVLFVVDHSNAAMSENQMKATVKMVRNVCQPKSKVTDEQLTAMHNGDWNQDKNAQCYYYCILTMYKLMDKENKFDWQGGIKALEANAPPRIGKPGAKSIENCKDAIKTANDKCMAAFEVVQCVYNDNPENFFLP